MNLSPDSPAFRSAVEAARRVACGQCAALAGDECVYTTAPVSAPFTADTPVQPVRGYHAGRLALAGNLVPGLVPAAIVWDNGDAPRYASLGPAHGPYQTEQQAREDPAVRAVYAAFRASPGTGRMTPHCHRILEDACSAAGVEAGSYDRRILAWLAEWGPPHAVRILARAWIYVLWRCWQPGTAYDPAKHNARRVLEQQDA